MIAPPLVWVLSRLPGVPRGTVIVPVARAETTPTAGTPIRSNQAAPADELLALAERDPLALTRRAQERFEQEVRDYRCVLIKQERVGGKLSAIEEVEVRVRNSPRTIYMLWRKNAAQAKRVLFKAEDAAFVDDEGRRLARVEPAGAVIRLFVTDIFMPINGEHARKVSRRTVDQCGFGATFELLRRFNEFAREKGVLDLRFSGTGEVDGRPTYVLTRYLPYDGEDGEYPDAKMVLHLDQEWLLPVAVESFADRAGKRLLGRYVFTKVELNPGLGEKDFEF